jgi:predicted transcriptional regulator
MFKIKLDKETDKRLAAAAKWLTKSKSQVACDAIVCFVGETETQTLSEGSLRQGRSS